VSTVMRIVTPSVNVQVIQSADAVEMVLVELPMITVAPRPIVTVEEIISVVTVVWTSTRILERFKLPPLTRSLLTMLLTSKCRTPRREYPLPSQREPSPVQSLSASKNILERILTLILNHLLIPSSSYLMRNLMPFHQVEVSSLTLLTVIPMFLKETP